jgi:hypothetical protein
MFLFPSRLAYSRENKRKIFQAELIKIVWRKETKKKFGEKRTWKLFVLISEGNRLCGNVALFAMFGCWREDSNSTKKRDPNFA